jgi:hypothetical protein
MGQWLYIYRSLKFVSDEELKSLLAEVNSINYDSISDIGSDLYTIDMSTFQAFYNASPAQADILVERFPEILNNLGYFYAFSGRIELVDHLLAKGCNETNLALGLIFGLRALETKSLGLTINLNPRSKNYHNKYSYYNEKESEEMYQLKLTALKQLFEKSADNLDKDVIYEKIIEKIHYNVLFAPDTKDPYTKFLFNSENKNVNQAKIFYESGQAKALQELFSMLYPDKSLREELMIKAYADDNYVIKYYLKNLSEVYLGMKLSWIDEMQGQQLLNQILDQVLLSTDALQLVSHHPPEELPALCSVGDSSLNHSTDICVDQLSNMGEASQEMQVDEL